MWVIWNVLIHQQWKANKFGKSGLALTISVVKVVTTVVVYFSQFFLFINNNKDFHQDQSSKSLKITKLTFQQWKANEFGRFRLVIAAGLNFYMLNFRDLFFSSMTIRTFIKTAVVGHTKQLKLPINNKKLINLEDQSLLLLPAWISVTLITVILSDILAQMRSRSWPFCLTCWIRFLLRCSRSNCWRPVFIVSCYIWPEFEWPRCYGSVCAWIE